MTYTDEERNEEMQIEQIEDAKKSIERIKKTMNKEFCLSDTEWFDGAMYLYNREDVQEFIRLLKKLPNSDGGYNCECVNGTMVIGGKGFTCEFCEGLNKLAGSKLVEGEKLK